MTIHGKPQMTSRLAHRTPRNIMRWSCLIACLFLAHTSFHCLQKAARACITDADCPPTSPEIYCFKGTCSKQACTPGQVTLCFDGPPEKANKGICRNGTRVCNDSGLWSPCLGQVLPQNEICDRRDNDCDGKTDAEQGLDCTCKPGTKKACYSGSKDSLQPKGTDPAKWPCQEGIQYCEVDNLWGPCYAEVVPQNEVCDKRDNDCDGQVDEDINCACTPGTKRGCPSSIPTRGICQQGEQSCGSDSVWAACQGVVPPQPELCDGKDNDCDGQIDGPRVDCEKHLLCISGKCQCPSPLVECNGRCTVIEQNSQNCGACGKQCPPGANCQVGKCTCPSGQTLCGNTCVNTKADAKHCGVCGTTCKEKEFCGDGTCKQCPANASTCGDTCCRGSQTCCNDQCVDTTTNATNCGGCGTKCKSGEQCCNGTCSDTSSDTANCGQCNTSQTPTACTANQQCCGGACVAKDAQLHCGACGKACANGEACCGGSCTPIKQNAKNCGQCGNTCNKGEQCCGLNGCIDTQTSIAHCGSCDNACTLGDVCCGGSCHYQECPTAQRLPALASLRDIAVDPRQHIVVVGNFRGTLTMTCNNPNAGQPPSTQTLKSKGETDIFLAKFDAKGTCLWIRGVGGKESDQGWALAITNDENIHITGAATSGFTFYSPVSDMVAYTNTIKTTTAAFILTVGSSGDPRKKYHVVSSLAASVGYDIAVEGNLSQGYAYITGVMGNDTSFGPHTAYHYQGSGPGHFVAALRLDTQEWIWARPTQANRPKAPQIAYGIAHSPARGEVAITGSIPSAGSTQKVFLHTHESQSGSRQATGEQSITAPNIGWTAVANNVKGEWYTTGHGTVQLGAYNIANSFITKWKQAPSRKLAVDWTAQPKLLHLAGRAIAVRTLPNQIDIVNITGGFEEVGLGGKKRFGVGIAQYNTNTKKFTIREAESTLPATASGITYNQINQLFVVGHFLGTIDFAPPKQDAATPPDTTTTAGFLWRLRIKP